jgi:hypothetical protein
MLGALKAFSYFWENFQKNYLKPIDNEKKDCCRKLEMQYNCSGRY